MNDPENERTGVSGEQPIKRVQTMGTLRLFDEETQEVILIPTPSNHPDDPLNWSQGMKYYITFLVCFAIFIGSFIIAGPAVQIVAIAMEFKGAQPGTVKEWLQKVAYFISACSLFQGMGNIFWIPLINKYGRRPMYISSFSLFLASSFWAVFSKTYTSELVARLVIGFSAGASECLAPLTITEMFFVHERGKMVSRYICSPGGISGGIVLSGLITVHLPWQYIYYVAIPFVGATALLIILTFPETNFQRAPSDMPPASSISKESSSVGHIEAALPDPLPAPRGYLHSLRVFHGTYTQESMVKMMVRPILALVLPPVLWATCAMGINIGFLIIVSLDYGLSFSIHYGFAGYQSSLCWLAGVIGASDLVMGYLAKENNGIRDPEMRLPVMIIPGVCGPLALVLYGASFQNHWHWAVPTVAIGLAKVNFSLVISSSVSMVYIVDAYRPIAGETVVTKMVFKAAFAFLLSFYGTKWIETMGYLHAFASMAGIYVAVFILGVPLYLHGRDIRMTSISWRIMRYLQWHGDRETGE